MTSFPQGSGREVSISCETLRVSLWGPIGGGSAIAEARGISERSEIYILRSESCLNYEESISGGREFIGAGCSCLIRIPRLSEGAKLPTGRKISRDAYDVWYKLILSRNVYARMYRVLAPHEALSKAHHLACYLMPY